MDPQNLFKIHGSTDNAEVDVQSKIRTSAVRRPKSSLPKQTNKSVKVLGPQKFRACGAQGCKNQAPVFRNSSYYKGGENQKKCRPASDFHAAGFL
jgi:hypothetical protein